MNTICALCEKPAIVGNHYCSIHNKAWLELKKKYPDWKIAYEDISWERYLETIVRLKESGDLAKAVATDELRRAQNEKAK